MAWPAGGGDTRIKLISSGSMSAPKVGDSIDVKLGKNITAAGFTVLINRGAGFVTLTTSLPYLLQSADIPPIGGNWPLYVVASDLSLRSDTVAFTNPPIAPTVLSRPVINGTPNPGTSSSATAATFSGTPAPTVVRTWYVNDQLYATAATSGPLPQSGALRVRDTATNSAGSVFADSDVVQIVPVNNALPTVPAGTLLADYTTASRAFPNGLTDNTDGPYPGKTSNVTANLNPGNTVNIRPLDISPTAIDIRGGIVSIAFKLRPSGTFARAVANLGNCYVNLYNNASPSTTQTNYMRVVFGSLTFRGERIVDGWNIMRFPVEMFGTVGTIADVQAYLQSVRYAGIEFNHNSTNADSFMVSVDFSNNILNPVSKGMVVLGFDDCRRDTYAYAYPKMKALGFPGVLYPGNVKASLDQNNTFFLNTANVLEMQADGWQMAYQAYNTEAPTMSVADFETQEIQPLLAFYPPKGFNGPNDGSYFSNISYGSMYQPVFDQYFRTMRDYSQFNDAASPRPESIPPNDIRKLRAYGVNTAANSATNGMIPYAKRAGTWRQVAIFVWHALGAGDAKLAADGGVLTGFEALLAWLDSSEGRAAVDVVTWAEVVRRWRAAAGQ